MIGKKLSAVLAIGILLGSLTTIGVVFAVVGTACNSGVTFGSKGVGLPCFTGGNPSPLPASGTIWYSEDFGCVMLSTNGTVKPLCNGAEGNWTSWALYDTQNVTSFASSGTPYVRLSQDGTQLNIVDANGEIVTYVIASKTLSSVSPITGSGCFSEEIFCITSQGVYLVQHASADVEVLKNSVVIQTLGHATYGWINSNSLVLPGIDQTGRWIVVDAKNPANTQTYYYIFQGVGSP
jgi:hypothetical protein